MSNIILTENAPAAVGPFSQAIFEDGWLYVSGQLGLNPKTNTLPEGVEAQCRQALDNLGAILKQAGLNYPDVVKVTIYLNDIKDFATINAIYSTYFSEHYPARSCFQVAALPLGGLFEIECVAHQAK